MTAKTPKEFIDFIHTCDKEGIDPITTIRNQTHERIDKHFKEIENKYRNGRDGKTWADLAKEVYDDVKDGWDKLSKAAADACYGND